MSVVQLNRHEGQLQSWNVAYQRTLPGNMTAEVAYVGNRGKDILASIDLNAGYTIGADRAGQPLFVKWGRTASTSDVLPVKSTYHSMQVKVDHRLKGGLMVTNSYTLGRAYSYSNGDGGPTISTPALPERGWQQLTASAAAQAVKLRACRAYKSQIPLLGGMRVVLGVIGYEARLGGESVCWA